MDHPRLVFQATVSTRLLLAERVAIPGVVAPRVVQLQMAPPQEVQVAQLATQDIQLVVPVDLGERTLVRLLTLSLEDLDLLLGRQFQSPSEQEEQEAEEAPASCTRASRHSTMRQLTEAAAVQAATDTSSCPGHDAPTRRL